MANHSIKLINEIASLNDSKRYSDCTGFIVKFESKKFIVSVHHFLPLISTYLNINSEKIKLNKIKDIYWNEINIFEFSDSKFFLNTKIIKDLKTRFIKPGQTIKIEIKNKFEKFPSVDYQVIALNPLSKLRGIYMRFYIGEYKDDENLKIFKGLSGSPVFSNEDFLIGLFCKIQIIDNRIFGLVLPTIYIIKSIIKNDSQSLYSINLDSYENLKIGNYDILKEEEVYHIYYPSISHKIPIDIFHTLEGDDDKFLQIKNPEISSLRYMKNENFDISLNIQKNSENQFKLNTGFLSLLFSYGYKMELQNIVQKYYKTDVALDNIWIKI